MNGECDHRVQLSAFHHLEQNIEGGRWLCVDRVDDIAWFQHLACGIGGGCFITNDLFQNDRAVLERHLVTQALECNIFSNLLRTNHCLVTQTTLRSGVHISKTLLFRLHVDVGIDPSHKTF